MSSTKHIEFGTKAVTLNRLRPVIKSAIILPQIHFDVSDWDQHAPRIVRNIQRRFKDRLIIIRSSSVHEDTQEFSKAGAFASILNVQSQDASAIFRAINAVLNSYGDKTPEHQVLVQPQLTAVTACGVMFTCDIQCGAPYYVINYDESGATDKITGGYSGEQITHCIYKRSGVVTNDSRLAALITCAQELESLMHNDALDIEFAFTSGQKLYLFQVRPIAQKKLVQLYRRSNIQPLIQDVKAIIHRTNEQKHSAPGRRTILSDMADWNPAELIGSHPRPLALSVFETLIADSTWREARAELGYYNPTEEKLIVTLAGRPYVDTRNSFNSLLPDTIDLSLRERVIDESLDYLQARPYLHDKVEFEVATNCFTFEFEERVPRFRAAGLTGKQIADARQALLVHTDAMIRQGRQALSRYMADIEQMDRARSATLAAAEPENLLGCIRFLLVDCKKRGTKGFSAIARMAFVGNALLRSFVTRGAISCRSYGAFFQSFPTIPGHMGRELLQVKQHKVPVGSFLAKYGHLRPGTFDILSQRYDEASEFYFGGLSSVRTAETTGHDEPDVFKWTHRDLKAMQSLISDSGLSLDVADILEFTRAVTIDRENAKFLFTRNLSDALRLIAEWGKLHDLAQDDLSYLRLDFILSRKDKGVEDVASRAQAELRESRMAYQRDEQIILPELIASVADIEHVRFFSSRPNFITQQRVVGSPLVLESKTDNADLQDRIVFIESADPGFDWIFVHKIRGLVTKYGGAGSHMAIRCGEHGLPAAIGVGKRFDQLKLQPLVEIDCANHFIRFSQA